jgi:BolA protein
MSEARITLIRERLQAALHPVELLITDESHKHVGHEGAKSGKGHFHVKISSNSFEGLNAVRQHQLIYEALAELMHTEIHALSIEASTPPKQANS